MSLASDPEDQFRSQVGEGRAEDSSGHPINRPSKRNRTNTSKEKAPRKKYVKGKQGGLQGIMKMPMEVFMEIAYHVHPGDLTSLIRTNKFFRAMLLNPSAILIWQRALGNVPGLPPCPTGMVEPQYVALMFSKYCTLCGAGVTSKPDPFLQVRLCSSCRDTQLGEKVLNFSGTTTYMIPFTMHIKRSKKSIHKHPMYYLLPQKRELDCTEKSFTQKGDQKGLAEWRLQQQESYHTQLKEGEGLLKYIDSTASSRLDELKDKRSERRGHVLLQNSRTTQGVGMGIKYFRFVGADGDAEKQWNSFVEVSKPLTERTWTNMLPKLIRLLEENRLRVDEFDREQRRYERESKATHLLSQLQRDTHPYQSIVDALQLERPPIEIGSISVEVGPLLSNPFPEAKIVRGWDFFANLYEEENDLEKVDEEFNNRRGIICEKLLEWRTEVEDQLVAQYISSIDNGPSSLSDTVLTVRGDTEATKDLYNNARFLLRADTVFTRKAKESFSEVDREHRPVGSHIHFPDMPRLMNDPELYDAPSYPGLEPEVPLDQYVRHAGKETISKALLKELQMPDVSHVELEDMGKAFHCGRCNHGGGMGWDASRHPVIFRNLHDLDPDANSKPLVRVVPSEGTNTPPPHSNRPIAHCLVCNGVDFYDDSSFDSLEQMREHMLEVHGAAEPVEQLHYIEDSNMLDTLLDTGLFDQRKWEEKWDNFHDRQGLRGSTTDAG